MSSLDNLDYDQPLKTMFKYTSFKNAFNILTNNKIYFAKLSEFNDPFDGLMAPDLSTKEKKESYIKDAKQMFGINSSMEYNQEQEFLNNQEHADKLARITADEVAKGDPNGFCCLTHTSDSLPMWAHYANNHTGCCLVFDFSKYLDQKEEDQFPFHNIKKIEYQKDFPMHSLRRFWHYYAHKSLEWEYEKEWRAVMFAKPFMQSYPNPFLAQKSNGPGLYSLGDFLCGVILGDKMEDAYKEVIKSVAHQRNINVQQASRKLYEYGIEVL